MTHRSMILFALLAAMGLSVYAEREEGDGVVLMRGRCFTPGESAGVLYRFAGHHADLEQWQTRRAAIRQGILEGAGLDKMPADREPPRVIAHSRRQMAGYTIQNIAIQTVPGYWVGANLYLPDGFDQADDQSVPAVLCPHGHWPDGRLAEFMQARCGAFARMGCAVLAYDILGEGDTTQVPHKHPLSLRLHHYNSTRALDYLASLPAVDHERLAVTGASGGGTQTFVLAAIDDRLDLSMPVCQVSAHFYGGCVCESGLPIHVRPTHETNNVEFAACFAPKPMLIVSNGKDWTKHTPLIEFPYIQRVYGHYGAADQVENTHLPNEGHDYGPSKRAAVYRFLAKHFDLPLKGLLDDKGAVTESWLEVLPQDELRVFDADHPRPADALDDPDAVFERLDKAIGR